LVEFFFLLRYEVGVLLKLMRSSNMSTFKDYKLFRLETDFNIRSIALGVTEEDSKSIQDLLKRLKEKNEITELHYEHCLRVAILAADIGKFIYMPQKPLFIAGALHDIGKCEVSPLSLGKISGWTPEDMHELRKHVNASWRMLRGKFDFTADVIVQHHRFQNNGYPKRLPSKLHKYSESTKLLILDCARVVALADVYDALHRVNDKFGETRALTAQEVKEKMFELNSDKGLLIAALYQEGILI